MGSPQFFWKGGEKRGRSQNSQKNFRERRYVNVSARNDRRKRKKTLLPKTGKEEAHDETLESDP